MPRGQEFDRTIRFRATARDERRLARVARHFARSPSEILRMMIAEAHAKLPKKPQHPEPATEPTEET